MKFFAVIGRPVLHSASPLMHNAAFAEHKAEAKYLRIAADGASQALQFARSLGVSGLNVTSPFKTEMAAAVSELDTDARITGSVNTVLFEGAITRGFNTDVSGVVQALQQAGLNLDGIRATVLGAGGAARSLVYALNNFGADICIANRTLSRAQDLAKQFGARALALDNPALPEQLAKSSLVINTISSNLDLKVFERLHAEMTVLDARYSRSSALIERALSVGAKVVDGREWLLYQGVKAYELFLNRPAPVEAMRASVYGVRGPKRNQRVALVGMMGTGKSSTAIELAKQLNRPVIELDAEIEKIAGNSVTQIFSQKGEGAFRLLESQALASAINLESAVISCGGGIVTSDGNINLLTQQARTIWLSASTQEILKRIGDVTSRPLLAGPSPAQKLEEIYLERRDRYAQVADLVIDTEARTPQEIASRILYELNAA